MIIAALIVILFAIAAWAAIYARGPYLLKLLVIMWIPMVGLLVVHSLNSYKGYPAQIDLPNDSRFISCIVEEPAGKFKGRIYLWLIPIDHGSGYLEYKPEQGEPRSYSEPYERQLHEACEKASKAQKRKGAGTVGFKKGIKSVRGSRRVHPYILPPRYLPPKGAR